jgi:hypothetical protein
MDSTRRVGAVIIGLTVTNAGVRVDAAYLSNRMRNRFARGMTVWIVMRRYRNERALSRGADQKGYMVLDL